MLTLKPWRFEVQELPGLLCVAANNNPKWLACPLREEEPLLQFLPTILARWIVENLFVELNLPEPDFVKENYYEDDRKRRWSPQQLNWVLQRVFKKAADGTQLGTFGGIEHESELCQGTPRIRCTKSFHGSSRKVVFPLIST